MALQKVEIPIMIDGGIDTKTDRKLTGGSSVLKSENVDFSQIGSIKKSKGTTQLTNSTNDSTDLSVVSSKIFSHNDEIVTIGRPGQKEIYSFNGQEDKWKEKSSTDKGAQKGSSFNAIETEVLSLQSDVNEVISHDSAECITEGYRVISTITADGDGYMYANLTKIDYVTKEESTVSTLLTQSLSLSRVSSRVEIDDKVDSVIYHVVLGGQVVPKLICNSYNNDLSLIGSVDLYTTDAGQQYDPSFDTIIYKNYLYVMAQGEPTNFRAFKIQNASILDSLFYTPTSHQVQVKSNATNIFDANKTSVSLCAYEDEIYFAWISLNDATSATSFPARDIWLAAVTYDVLNTITKTQTKIVDSATYAYCWTRLSIAPNGETGTIIVAANRSRTDEFYSVTSIDPKQLDNRVDIFKSVYGAGPFTTTYYKLGPSGQSYEASILDAMLKSRPLFVGGETDSFYLAVMTSTHLKNTYHIIKGELDSGYFYYDVVSRFAAYNGFTPQDLNYYGSAIEANIQNMILGEDDYYYFPYVYKGIDTGLFDQGAIPTFSIVKLGIGKEDGNYITTRLTDSTLVCNGLLRDYSGRNFLPSGFSGTPRIMELLEIPGTLAAGTYSFVCIYKYFDENGLAQSSDVSKPEEITIAASKDIRMTAAGNRQAFSPLKDLTCYTEVYRTVVDSPGPYYLVSRIPAYSGSPEEYFEFETFNTDAEIKGFPQIYTTGGVYAATIIPPMTYVAAGLDRVFGISANDKNVVFYSQKKVETAPTEWHPFLNFRIDGHGKRYGFGVGIENLDDKMIILKEDSIMAISGDGPTSAGTQDTFSIPAIISQEIGCTEKSSILATPVGVMFKGKKGIYLVDRSLQASYIGAAVEDYNSETIVSSDVSKTRNEVYFQTANRVMIFNYLQNKWSTNTYLKGKSLCIWKDNLAVLKEDGRIYYQTDVFKDNSEDISMKVTTPWYKTTGITGFGRLYEIMVLGEYKSDHNLNVRVYYDYSEITYDDYLFNVTAVDIYEFSVKPSRQKCQAFKIEIWDTPTGGSGESFELTGISLRVGAKKGLYKLPDSRKG